MEINQNPFHSKSFSLFHQNTTNNNISNFNNINTSTTGFNIGRNLIYQSLFKNDIGRDNTPSAADYSLNGNISEINDKANNNKTSSSSDDEDENDNNEALNFLNKLRLDQLFLLNFNRNNNYLTSRFIRSNAARSSSSSASHTIPRVLKATLPNHRMIHGNIMIKSGTTNGSDGFNKRPSTNMSPPLTALDLKKFTNLEDFYMKKMMEYSGFESKLLSRSESYLICSGRFKNSTDRYDFVGEPPPSRAPNKRVEKPVSERSSDQEFMRIFNKSYDQFNESSQRAERDNADSGEEKLFSSQSTSRLEIIKDLKGNGDENGSTRMLKKRNVVVSKRPNKNTLRHIKNNNNNSSSSSKKFFSPSLIILPELDETSTVNASSLTDLRNVVSKSNSSLNGTNQALKQQPVKSNNSLSQNNMNRILRPNQQSELTLPPIIESQVTSNKAANSGGQRVDSGVATDLKPAWTLSTQGSDQDELDARLGIAGTTEAIIELIESVNTTGAGAMRKNTTSSTLNSYTAASKTNSSKMASASGSTSNFGIKKNSSNGSFTNATMSKAINDQQQISDINNNYFINNMNERSTRPGSSRPNNTIEQNDADIVSSNSKFFSTTMANSRAKTAASRQASLNANPARLNRQNTNLSSVLNDAPIEQNSVMTRRSSVNTGNSNNNVKPTPKPRKNDVKAAIQRLNSSLAIAKNPVEPKSKETTDSILARPKTGMRAINQQPGNSSYSKMSNNGNTSLVKINRTYNPDMNTSRVNMEPMNAEQQVANNVDSSGVVEQPQPEENGLNEFTLQRILNWLEDIEKCTNMIKPPSQLTWSENHPTGLQSTHNKRYKQHHNNPSAVNTNNNMGLNNEYCLSDYDSFDEQIVEYNRVVDKTFHIVHGED